MTKSLNQPHHTRLEEEGKKEREREREGGGGGGEGGRSRGKHIKNQLMEILSRETCQ